MVWNNGEPTFLHADFDGHISQKVIFGGKDLFSFSFPVHLLFYPPPSAVGSCILY